MTSFLEDHFNFTHLVKYLFLVGEVLLWSSLLDLALVRAGRYYIRKEFPESVSKINFRSSLSPWCYLFIVSVVAYRLRGYVDLSGRGRHNLSQGLYFIVILMGLTVSIKISKLLIQLLSHHFETTLSDHLRKKSVSTRLQFIEKVTVIFCWFCAFILMVISFESVRKFGMSFLASAGVISIVIGFAAQKSLSNFLAGFQIAFTQPIRLDDVVIVEGQWGKIEEITWSYVVVCLWDLRRLVVPIHYFIEKPFENWTRSSADLLPFVLINADYGLPMQPLRQKFDELLKETPLWDKKVGIIQVVDSTEKTMVIRALMSARNASEAFDLRCFIREELIAFIRKNYPNCLPQSRVEPSEYLSERGLGRSYLRSHAEV